MAKTDIQNLVEVYESETDKENKDLLLDGLKKVIENDMQEADAEYKKFLTGIKSKFFGAKKSTAKKTTRKTTAKKSTRKKSTTTPEEKAEKQRKVNQSAGKTIEECKEIIAKYESLRSGNKKRVDKLEKEGKIIEGTDVKTAGASTETLSKEVKGKIDKQVDAIEKKAEKEAKKEVKTAGKSDAQVKKEVAKKTDAKIEKELSKLSKEMSSKAKEFIMSIKSVLKKDNPDEAKAFLLSVKAGIDAELKQFTNGGSIEKDEFFKKLYDPNVTKNKGNIVFSFQSPQNYDIEITLMYDPKTKAYKGGEIEHLIKEWVYDFDEADEIQGFDQKQFDNLKKSVDNLMMNATDVDLQPEEITVEGDKFITYPNLENKFKNYFMAGGELAGAVQGYEIAWAGAGRPLPMYAKGGKLNVIDSKLEQMMLAGLYAKELETVLDKQFPDSFRLEIFKRKDDYSLDTDYGTQLSDKDLSNIKFVFREKTSPRTLNFEVQQGGENTYFHFALFDTDYNNYVGTFGFKDRGDVDSSYVTKFISFLCDAYGYPFQANVHAKGGELSDSNLKRRLKLINVDANRILKDFDDEVLDTEHNDFVSLGTLVDNIEIASDLTTSESDSWILAKGGEIPSGMRAIWSRLKDSGFNAKNNQPQNVLYHNRGKSIATIKENSIHIVHNGKKKEIESMRELLDFLNEKELYAKGGNIDDTPKIYVADLEAYNNGQLVGEWVDLSEFDSGDEVMERISELLEKFGDKEEYAIHDYENFDSSLYSEYMGENEFDQIIQSYKVSEQFDIPAEVVQSIMTDYSPDDILEWIEDRYEGEFDSDTDLAYNYVENVGGIENVSNPEYYFDYEKFGRDLAMDYSEYNGHYFRSYAKGGKVPSYDLSKYVTGNYAKGGKVKYKNLTDRQVKTLKELGYADSQIQKADYREGIKGVGKPSPFINTYAKGGNTQLDAFMKREMERQAKAEAGKNFPKYRVSVFEDSYQFDQYSTNDFAEAVNWANERHRGLMKYRPTSKSLWAEISQFQAIEDRNNVIYPYKEITRWSTK